MSLRLPFVWLQCSNTKGKQAVLLESLFKESQSWWAPPTLATANRESALSRTKTSQARPFLHTRQKNAPRCSLLLPPTLLRMFWGRSRNDRNYDKAALFREHGLNIQRRFLAEGRGLWADAEQVVNSCASAARLWISLNRQCGWTSPGPRARREHLKHVTGSTSVLWSFVMPEQKWLLRGLNVQSPIRVLGFSYPPLQTQITPSWFQVMQMLQHSFVFYSTSVSYQTILCCCIKADKIFFFQLNEYIVITEINNISSTSCVV